jgi:hypothetical protein
VNEANKIETGLINRQAAKMRPVAHAIQYADILKQLPGYVSIHGLDFKVMWANDATLQNCGFRTSDEIYGVSYANLPCPAAEEYQTFFVPNPEVITLRQQGRSQEGVSLFLFCF